MADKAREKNNNEFPEDRGPIVEMRDRNHLTDPDETHPDYDPQVLLSQCEISNLTPVDLERLLKRERVIPS